MTEVVIGFDAAQRARVADLRSQGRFFWLDLSLRETSLDDLVQALGTPEDALRATPGSGGAYASRRVRADGQSIAFMLRCFVEAEGSRDAAYRLRPLEVRVVITGDYLLTLHDEQISLPTVLGLELPEGRSKRYVVSAVLGAMVESTFGALDEVEEQLEGLAETSAGDGGGRVARAALQAAGARLASMRRWVTAEKAVLQRTGVEIGALPAFDTDHELYFDRLDEQVNALLASIDAAGDAMGMLLDLQLNARAYLVSVVATIFVPLTFVTGYFGMNLGWMIDHLESRMAFWLFGVAVPIATAALSWRFLVRRFVMDDDRRARSR